jgi:hypothetical protein
LHKCTPESLDCTAMKRIVVDINGSLPPTHLMSPAVAAQHHS